MAHTHTDILDQAEPLGRSLAGAVALHVMVAGTVIGLNLVGHRQPVPWGDPLGGGPGSVSVNVVNRVPLPARTGMVNPLANDSESAVPEPPAKAKPSPKIEQPDPDAIALKSRNAKKRAARAASNNKFRAQLQDRPNQVYSTSGQALTSPMYGQSGGGGVGVGNNSPFGTQFGWYVNLLREQVGRSWKQNDIDPRLRTAPPVIVNFTIRRDGSLSGQVRLVQRSGVAALDYSAQRAVYDAAPFRALPAGFNRDEATVEFWFELKR